MRRIMIGVLVIIALAFLGWSALWVMLSRQIPAAIAREEAAIAARGGALSHDDITISGYPLSHVTRIEGLRYVAPPQDGYLAVEVPWATLHAGPLSPLSARGRIAERIAVETELEGARVEGVLSNNDLVLTFIARTESPRVRLTADSLAFIPDDPGGPALTATSVKGLALSRQEGTMSAETLSFQWPARRQEMAARGFDAVLTITEDRAAWRLATGSLRLRGPGGAIISEGSLSDIDMPLRAAPAAQAFAAAFSLDSPQLDEAMWDELDPTGQFPRELGPMEARLTGEIVLRRDAEAIRSEDDIELRAVTLEHLGLSVAGVELSAQGTMTDFMIAPDGTLTVMAKGWREAINDAVARNLIPPQTAMIASALIAGSSERDEETGASRITVTVRDADIFLGRMRVARLPGY